MNERCTVIDGRGQCRDESTGPDGLCTRHHMQAVELAARTLIPPDAPDPVPTPPPVTAITSLEDVKKMHAWVIMEVARGAMSEKAARALKMHLDSYRMAWKDTVGKRKIDKLTRAVDALNDAGA